MALSRDELRARVAELLLPELKEGNRRWFYVSIANEDGFIGGVFVQAFGTTDTFNMVHNLNLYPRDSNASTQSTELPVGSIDRVPESMRWRLLSREEVENLQQVMKDG